MYWNKVAMMLQEARILYSHAWCLEYVQRQQKEKKEVLEALLVEVAAKVFVFCRWSAPAAPLLCFSAQLLMLFLTKVSLLPGLDWRRRLSSWEDEKALLESSELIPCMLQLFWRVLIHIPAFDPHTCFRFSYYNFPFSSQVSISKSFFFWKI